MGVNLHIDIPGWDPSVNGGMKQICYDDIKFPKKCNDNGCELYFRPENFFVWRESIRAQNMNVDMWLQALDALESNHDLWIRASY